MKIEEFLEKWFGKSFVRLHEVRGDLEKVWKGEGDRTLRPGLSGFVRYWGVHWSDGYIDEMQRQFEAAITEAASQHANARDRAQIQLMAERALAVDLQAKIAAQASRLKLLDEKLAQATAVSRYESDGAALLLRLRQVEAERDNARVDAAAERERALACVKEAGTQNDEVLRLTRELEKAKRDAQIEEDTANELDRQLTDARNRHAASNDAWSKEVQGLKFALAELRRSFGATTEAKAQFAQDELTAAKKQIRELQGHLDLERRRVKAAEDRAAIAAGAVLNVSAEAEQKVAEERRSKEILQKKYFESEQARAAQAETIRKSFFTPTQETLDLTIKARDQYLAERDLNIKRAVEVERQLAEAKRTIGELTAQRDRDVPELNRRLADVERSREVLDKKCAQVIQDNWALKGERDKLNDLVHTLQRRISQMEPIDFGLKNPSTATILDVLKQWVEDKEHRASTHFYLRRDHAARLLADIGRIDPTFSYEPCQSPHARSAETFCERPAGHGGYHVSYTPRGTQLIWKDA